MSAKLLKSTASVGAVTLVSRLLGFLRDMVLARAFGAGVATDAFFVAFKIPNFLRRLFAEGAFSLAFVPVLSEYKTRRDRAEVKLLVERVAGTLAGVLFLVTLAGVAAAPLLVLLFAPGFADEPDRFAITVEMLRITFPYIFFISLTAFAGGILNAYGRFAVPAFTPVLLNLVLIGAALWLAPRLERPIVGLAWGVFIAGAAQLLFQLPFLARLGLLPRPRWGWHGDGVQRILRLMGPAVFGSSVAQVNLLLDTLIASFLAAGSVSWLYYSDRLMEFPLGVFGVALSTVVLPALSRRHAEADPAAFSHTLDWALRLALIVGLPAAVGLAVLAGPTVATLFHYGSFGAADLAMSRLSLIAFALGLPAFVAVKVLAPAFYARQDTRTPVRIGVTAMVANMGLNVALVVPMVLLALPAPHAGLALATSLAAYLNAALLYRAARREGVAVAGPGWPRLLLLLAVANGAMGLLLWLFQGEPGQWTGGSASGRVARLAGLILAGVAAYFALFLLGGGRGLLHREERPTPAGAAGPKRTVSEVSDDGA